MKKLLLSVLFLLLSCSAAMAQSSTLPDSREYKVLLKAENFASIRKGCELFWELIEKVATDHGFTAKKTVKSSPNREIRFIDSPDFDLNKKGFLLRIRTEKDKSEMTLKFRASDLESAIIAPVEPAKQYGDDVSSEVDIVVKAATPVSIFSKSGKIKNFKRVPDTVKDLQKYYPGLAKANINESFKLTTVNNIVVIEQRILHGTIDFGFDKTKTLFSLWYVKGESTPMVAEFSFKIKTDAYLKRVSNRSQNLIDNFFVDLVRRGKLFISPQQTKTGMIYQYQTDD
ncbi:MAG: hypothetical protein CVV42_02565 [Candidatus Riflebacteria bacterium HGW-Riflebacteria-2]|jgi:hypothetical protein|nr:MAG: hypothetical protein CVV42_02565 [Candidatus Riflebacteria bacterium HGW-Riflebacteria-2]